MPPANRFKKEDYRKLTKAAAKNNDAAQCKLVELDEAVENGQVVIGDNFKIVIFRDPWANPFKSVPYAHAVFYVGRVEDATKLLREVLDNPAAHGFGTNPYAHGKAYLIREVESLPAGWTKRRPTDLRDHTKLWQWIKVATRAARGKIKVQNLVVPHDPRTDPTISVWNRKN